MRILKIRKIGESAGIVLPADVLEALGYPAEARLHLKAGEEGFELRPYEPDVDETLERARGMAERRGGGL